MSLFYNNFSIKLYVLNNSSVVFISASSVQDVSVSLSWLRNEMVPQKLSSVPPELLALNFADSVSKPQIGDLVETALESIF
jgi:hypothetical protein